MSGRHRVVSAALLALLATTAPGVPVSADTHVGGNGPVGPHFLADTQEYPGVRCRYGATTQVFSGVKVRAPFLYARDRTAGRDHQRVTWQVILKRQQDESLVWQTIDQGPVRSATAWDDTPAAFAPVTLGHGGEAVSAYRVIVKLTWSVPGDPGTTQGTARHRVDWYRWPLDPAHEGFCVGAIL